MEMLRDIPGRFAVLVAAATFAGLGTAAADIAVHPPMTPVRLGSHHTVTITNVTRGQSLTPALIVVHRPGVELFELGMPASPELVALAEEGNTGPFTSLLESMPDVYSVATTGVLLMPGESVSVEIDTKGDFDRLTVAAMLIPTNDGFFAVQGVRLPNSQKGATYLAMAYDAGSEVNDELCASIPGPMLPFPGPECGLGGSPGGGEGYVYVHPGIHGGGDLQPAQRDWKNPVAVVKVD